MRGMKFTSALLLAFALTFSACAVEEPSGSDSASRKGSDVKEASVDPAAVKASFEKAAGTPIEKMGDPTTWHPYFDNIEERNSKAVTVNLSTPGDFGKGEIKALAKKAGIDIFNFAGEAHPELEQIVVFVNGRDSATVNRSDAPLLN